MDCAINVANTKENIASHANPNIKMERTQITSVLHFLSNNYHVRLLFEINCTLSR